MEIVDVICNFIHFKLDFIVNNKKKKKQKQIKDTINNGNC